MQYLDAKQTAELLSYDQTAKAIDHMLHKIRGGTAHAPVRHTLEVGDSGVLIMMPAKDETYACVKVVTVHPQNIAHKLPSIQGELLLMEAKTGQRLLMLDGPTVTSRRTAALSLLGARKLSPNNSDTMLLIGSGVQARAHVDAFVQNWGIKRLRIFSVLLEQADDLARYASETYGISAKRIEKLDAAALDAGLIVTATTSLKPVLQGPVPEDCMIVAMGAYRPDMAEISPAVIHQCDVYVDTFDGAKEEAGDLIQSGLAWSGITPLHMVETPRKGNGRPVLFKTVGDGLWDLAAAELAYDNLTSTISGKRMS